MKKIFLAMAAVSMALFLQASAAQAGGWSGHGGHGSWGGHGRWGGHHGYSHGYYGHGYSNGAAIALGVTGALFGAAALVDAFSPHYYYSPPAPVYYGPPPAYYYYPPVPYYAPPGYYYPPPY